LPRLKHLCVLATGYNIVVIFFAKKQNFYMSDLPAYSTESIAQMVLALLLEITNQFGSLSRQLINDKWTKNKVFCFYNHHLMKLNNLTLGDVGYGKIGKSIIKKALTFEKNLKFFT
jgi:glycerate dehydrogenase